MLATPTHKLIVSNVINSNLFIFLIYNFIFIIFPLQNAMHNKFMILKINLRLTIYISLKSSIHLLFQLRLFLLLLYKLFICTKEGKETFIHIGL